MATAATPIVIAYDGSDVSRAGLERGAELFPDRLAIVATVWEPRLAAMPMAQTETFGGIGLPPDPETIEAVDQAQRRHATAVAEEGAARVSALGLAAEAHVVADEADVADTLIELARERGAAAIVVGSHGTSGLRSHLVGSVARKLLAHSDRPVVVVRSDER
jgi:nucleotide-binding universal stress UspA family protein